MPWTGNFMVAKMQKVSGLPQMWAVYDQRKGVSATASALRKRKPTNRHAGIATAPAAAIATGMQATDLSFPLPAWEPGRGLVNSVKQEEGIP